MNLIAYVNFYYVQMMYLNGFIKFFADVFWNGFEEFLLVLNPN